MAIFLANIIANLFSNIIFFIFLILIKVIKITKKVVNLSNI